MDIVDLKFVLQFLPILAEWHHREWAYLNPGRSLEQRIADMQEHLHETLVPSTWVAVVDDVPAGSASLLHADMDTHPELTPWLASVYVAPDFRRRGIASRLVQQVMAQAQQDGIETLYLFTPDQAPLYAGLGWKIIKEEKYFGALVALMSVQL